MTKSELAKLCTPIGIAFVIAGLAVLVLGYLNYRQDGKAGSSFFMGFFIILLGVFFNTYARKLKTQNK